MKSKKGGKGGHTGKIHGMGGMHLKSHGGKDQHASSEHHKANADHGMHQGFCPPEGYQGHAGQEDSDDMGCSEE